MNCVTTVGKNYFIVAILFFCSWHGLCMEKEEGKRPSKKTFFKKIGGLFSKKARRDKKNKSTPVKLFNKLHLDILNHILHFSKYKKIGKELVTLSPSNEYSCNKRWINSHLYVPLNLNTMKILILPIHPMGYHIQFYTQLGICNNELTLYRDDNSKGLIFNPAVTSLKNKQVFFDGLNKHDLALVGCNGIAPKKRCSFLILRDDSKKERWHSVDVAKKMLHNRYDQILFESPAIDGNITALALHYKSDRLVLCLNKGNKNRIHVYDLRALWYWRYSVRGMAMGDLPCAIKKICMLTQKTYLGLSPDGKVFVLAVKGESIDYYEQKIYYEMYEKKTLKKKKIPYEIKAIAVNPLFPYLVTFASDEGKLFHVNLKNIKNGSVRFGQIADNIKSDQLWFYDAHVGYLKASDKNLKDKNLKIFCKHEIGYNELLTNRAKNKKV